MWRMKDIWKESQEQKDHRSRPKRFRIIATNVAISFKNEVRIGFTKDSRPNQDQKMKPEDKRKKIKKIRSSQKTNLKNKSSGKFMKNERNSKKDKCQV